MSKKIAFCFFTYDNLSVPHIWEDFFKQANPDQYSIYVHAKYPENVTQDIVKNHLIPEHYETGWCHISFLRAIMKVLDFSFKDLNTYKAITISQSCTPIQSFNAVYRELTRHDKGFLSWYPEIHKHNHGRLKDPNFVTRDQFSFHNDQGIVFTRKINDFFVANDNIDLFENVSCPSEHYISNNLTHYSKEDWIEKKRLNLCENSGGGRIGDGFPSISEEKVLRLRKEGYLFCRKYRPGAEIPDMCIKD